MAYSIVDASVATSLGHSTETNSHGRFRLRDVFEASPFSIRIRVFGYLPVEREILPGDGDDYDFALTEDPIVAGRIAEQSVRLMDRASPRFSVGRPNLNREQILRYAGAHTVFDMLLFRYGERKLDAVSCVVIDERPFMANGETQAMLYGLLPEQVERVEFMFRGQMIRLYTRDFLREMISRDVKLRAPAIFPICQ